MAEVEVVSAVEQKQGNPFVQGADLASGVEEQVEWIESEMKVMYASLEHVEALERYERDEGAKAWVEESADVAREAEDLIENFLHRSAQRQRRGVFKKSVSVFSDLIERYKHDMALQRLKFRFHYVREHDIFRWPKSFEPLDDSNRWKTSDDSSDDAVSSAVGYLNGVLPLIRCLHRAIVGEQTEKRSCFAVDMEFSRIVMQLSSKELAKQVEWTQRGLEEMKAFLMHVWTAREVDASVLAWVEQIRSVASEAWDVVRDIHNKAEHKKMGIFRSRMARRKIMRIKIQIFETCRRISTNDKEGIRAIRDDSSIFENLHQTGQSIISDGDVNDVIGREDDKNRVKDLLISGHESRAVISIVGMKGIGRKTLARMVYRDADIEVRFPHRAWVSVEEDSDTIGFLRDIGGQLMGFRGIKGKWNEEQQAMEKLRAFLSNRRYLIVLVNIWRTETWNSLQAAFPDTSIGSRILLTTCSKDFALHAQSVSLYNMPLLTELESWVLFTHTLKEDILAPELVELGRAILVRCGGLPLAIVTTGGFLAHHKGKGNSELWLSVKERMGGYQSPWLENLYKMNEDLPWYLRRCLFYFGLFSADFKIPCRRLTMLWVAEGLVHQKGGGGDQQKEPLEHVAERYLTELVNRNMVQVTEKKITGKVKTCRLPDTLRAQLLSKAKKARFLQGQSQSQTQTSTASTSESPPADHTGVINIRRLADHFDEQEPSFEHIHGRNINTNPPSCHCYRDVLSFLSFDYRAESKPGEEIGNFLDRCISSRCFLKLRVLDLEHVFRPKLPKALGKLIRLRYLGLRWTYLEKLPPFVSKLLNLQTLDLKHTYISTLPGSIWEMQYLRHLYLSETHRSRFVPRPRRCYLTHLQTLWGVCVDEESQVKDGLDTMLNIRKLGVSCRFQSSSPEHELMMSSKLDAVAAWIEKLKHQLETLRLKSYDELGQPWNLHLSTLKEHLNLSSLYLLGRLNNPSVVKEFPPNLIEVTFSATGLQLQDDPMETLGKLPNLRVLRLFHESFVGERMHCSLESFPQLRVLKLWKLERLMIWYVEKGALPNLQELEIRSCTNLVTLPDGLRHIMALKEVKLSNMPEKFIEEIEDHQSQGWYKIADVRVENGTKEVILTCSKK